MTKSKQKMHLGFNEGQLSTQNKQNCSEGGAGGNHPLKDQCPLSGPLCTKWVNDFIDIRKYAFYEFDYFFSNLEGPILFHHGCRILRKTFKVKHIQM